ncbi:MAG: hypothetical protein MRZ79_22715 [Bacteroidia bacterium]|nr:hypothetical protein [Bacteroidia bacterium]
MSFKKDIEIKIKTQFSIAQQPMVNQLLSECVETGLNVGTDQFLRAVLFLSKGDLQKLKRILEKTDDPRDLLHKAEDKSGKLEHWFAIPFEEIEELKGQKYTGNALDFPLEKFGDDEPF